MKYMLPPDTHSVSVGVRNPETEKHGTLEFVADEHGHIDLGGQPALVVRQLVELAGCKPVRDDHPPIPVEPTSPPASADEPPEGGTPEADGPETDAPANAAVDPEAAPAPPPVPLDAPLRLDPAKRSLTPPRRTPRS